MLYFILIVVGFIGLVFIMKNIFDKPLTQHLINKDNKEQREHEQLQEEKKREFWKEKNEIKGKEKREDFVRDYVINYIKSNSNINNSDYIINKVLSEIHKAGNNIIDGELDVFIDKISSDEKNTTNNKI